MHHQEITQNTLETFQRVAGVEKILLYGSVSRGEEKEDSDVDIAVILGDDMRNFPLDMSGFPSHVMDISNRLINAYKSKYDTMLHLVFYWSSELEKGILLSSGNRKHADRLEAVGKVVYDFWKDSSSSTH